ncbi:MAG: hypothetical protein RL223_2772 [Pseudomonadota bacterium]|jgi:hypothetical protein
MNAPASPAAEWPLGAVTPAFWRDIGHAPAIPADWRATLVALRDMGRADQLHLRALTGLLATDRGLERRLLDALPCLASSAQGPLALQGTAHAVSLLGFGTVGMLTTLLMLLQGLQQDASAAEQAAARTPGRTPAVAVSRATLDALAAWRDALMAALLAHALHPGPSQGQRAWLLALLHDLPAVLHGVPGLMAAPIPTTARLAQAWDWPPALCAALQALDDDPSSAEPMATTAARTPPGTADHRLARRMQIARTSAPLLLRSTVTSRAALARTLAARQDAEATEDRTGEPVDAEGWCALFERALSTWTTLAQRLDLPALPADVLAAPEPVPAPAPHEPQRPATDNGAAASAAPKAVGSDTAAAGPGEAPAPHPPLARPPARPPLSAAPALIRGIEDFSRGLLGDAPLADLVEPALLAVLQALQWQRLMLCLPDQPDGPLVARHAVGERLRVLLPQVRIAWRPPTDLFGLLLREQQDSVVADALRTGRTARLPAWFHDHAGAAGFVALPLAWQGQPMGLLYGDVPLSHRLMVDEPTLGQLRTLRNLMVAALRLRQSRPADRHQPRP